MSNDEIMVSIYCLAYNHEKYIKSALDGFVMQKTNFHYEVFVHDDASKDRTAEIIKEYQIKYPEIIKPIFQTENQYSKGINISDTFIFPLMKGKYIAVCEGDDFWCDEYKLQKQVDFLEEHPEYSACAHNTLFRNEKNGEEYIFHDTEQDCDLKIEDIFKWENKIFHISGLMFRKKYFIRPKEFYMGKVGDYPRGIYLALQGKIRFFKDVVSVYRICTEGSWSSIYASGSVDKIIELNTDIINMLEDINNYTGGQYQDIIRQVQIKKKYVIAMKTKQFQVLLKEYRELLRQEPKKIQLYVFMNGYFPGIMKVYYAIKSKFK
ncbi:MAG: glycosyltransferase family 2 protein [Lachnospiraceae bacterium]|nr:glycosyltransferase family 2 protein [Lachnospiraceae bacterium]